MDKFNGLKLTSFILGVCLPLTVCCYLINALLSVKPEIIPVPTEEKVILAESFTEIFSVDYDMYGKYEIGVNKIVGEVYNNSSNAYDCNIWLEDVDGSIISDVIGLAPSERGLVFITTNTYDVAGEYDAKLIYEVLVGEQRARIECPYVVLVNGGL